MLTYITFSLKYFVLLLHDQQKLPTTVSIMCTKLCEDNELNLHVTLTFLKQYYMFIHIMLSIFYIYMFTYIPWSFILTEKYQ